MSRRDYQLLLSNSREEKCFYVLVVLFDTHLKEIFSWTKVYMNLEVYRMLDCNRKLTITLYCHKKSVATWAVMPGR